MTTHARASGPPADPDASLAHDVARRALGPDDLDDAAVAVLAHWLLESRPELAAA
jgi:hypothetical protein